VESDALAVMRREREDTAGIVEVEGAGAFLRVLPADRWAIVTSADRVLARNRIRAAGLPVPDILVSADDVQQGKPSPDGYLLAARLLNVNAADCIVFEDAPAGIEAGLRAGARVIAVASPLMEGRLHDFDYLNDLNGIAVSMKGNDLVVDIT
jgi:sugar-phosphatase